MVKWYGHVNKSEDRFVHLILSFFSENYSVWSLSPHNNIFPSFSLLRGQLCCSSHALQTCNCHRPQKQYFFKDKTVRKTILTHRDHYCKSILWTIQWVTNLSFYNLLQVKIMYKEDQVMAKGCCQDCNMSNQILKNVNTRILNFIQFGPHHPKSSTDLADG